MNVGHSLEEVGTRFPFGGFEIVGCLVERWGAGGSGIDMVGCSRGEIAGCTLKHGDEEGATGIQAKGGTRNVRVQYSRFLHAGRRAINIGGSTGLQYFRPAPEGFEAKDITVVDNVFVGSNAPIAFVGVDGALVAHNTIYRPQRWVFRILQETREPGFVPSRNGVFANNLIVYGKEQLSTAVNVGPDTAPQTFVVRDNAWYALDVPHASRPDLPVAETGGVYGVDPELRDPEAGDFRTGAGASIGEAGARAGSIFDPRRPLP